MPLEILRWVTASSVLLETSIEAYPLVTVKVNELKWKEKLKIPSIVINFPWTYEKLYCKSEPHWCSGKRNPSVHTDRQAHRDHVTLLYNSLQGYKGIRQWLRNWCTSQLMMHKMSRSVVFSQRIRKHYYKLWGLV